MITFATGGNFEIVLTHGIAVCRIWMRPDVTREEGAGFAQQKVALLSDLARRPRLVAKGLLLDMREAPPKWGPVTQVALEQIFQAWEQAGRHIGVLTCADPIQAMILRQTFKSTAPTCGRIFTAIEQAAAESWCRLAPTPVGTPK
jgi:hypothetical protein